MILNRNRTLERLRSHPAFDANWYSTSFPDVPLTKLEPVEHYLGYGHRLLRDPGPRFSTAFIKQVFHMSEKDEPILTLERLKRRGILPDDTEILHAASRVADLGREDLAVDLATSYLPEHLSHTALLLNANAALSRGHEEEWLASFNSYLAAQGVTGVSLSEGSTLIERLRPAKPLAPVTGGPLVSVIMACWNSGALVTMAAQSILQQTWRNLELLIVDDGSTDETWSRLEVLAGNDSRVKILRNRINVGPYVSKNIAVTQANGSYITCHDADDWAHPQRIERQVHHCQTRDLPACLSGMLRIAPNGRFVRFNKIGGNVHDGACRSAFISLMADARVFHGGFGFWDEVRVAGDSELIHRMEAILGEQITHVPVTTMTCLDNPGGLTNSSTLGHSEGKGVAPARAAYKKRFIKYHKSLDVLTSRYEFPAPARRFKAPSQILDTAQKIAAAVQDHTARGMRLRLRIKADVVIVTNLRFPGGNASSTLDEVRLFQSAGLDVALIHSPVTRDIARTISDRFAPHADIIVDWSRIESVVARVLIVRHPAVVTADPFKRIVDRFEAENTYAVINNSLTRADGRAVYDMADMVSVARRIKTKKLEFCPIGPLMRKELRSYSEPLSLALQDWTPTLNPDLYRQAPKPTLSPPFSIGRHGRDGKEKWHESATVLKQVYPDDDDYRIVILGGARQAQITLGDLPPNWKVYNFGEITPHEYLADLDIFVYYPQSTLIEAFGRTIAEAMMAGVPCILPNQLSTTFGNLSFYSTPDQVRSLIKILAEDDEGRIMFISEVQKIVLERFSTDGLRRRFAGSGLFDGSSHNLGESTLSAESQAYRARIMARIER